MAARRIISVFDEYEKAKMAFVHNVSELASRSCNVQCLENFGAVELLRPLLTDVNAKIRYTSALALGKLANLSERSARTIAQNNLIPQLLHGIDEQTKYYKKSAMYLLRSVSKHSPELAEVITCNGGMQAMIVCMSDFDYEIKESAALGMGNIARHNNALALKVIDAGAIPCLALCLQEVEICLKQASAYALSEIAKHSEESAEAVVNAGCVYFIAKSMCNADPKLKHQTLSALANIAKHSTSLAETVVEAEVFPDVLILMSHPSNLVARSAAYVVREVTKHSLELCQMIVNSGGVGALVNLVGSAPSETRLPAIMALGHIGAFSDQLSLVIAECHGVTTLSLVLRDETEDHVVSATVWALGHIGKHSAQHAQIIAEADVFLKIVDLYVKAESSEDLKEKCKTTLSLVLQKCTVVSALEPLLFHAPSDIVKYTLGQFSKILPKDAKARRSFVESGGLKKVQEVKAEPGSTLMEYISIINCCFPEDIVRYFSPGYPTTLLERVEQYEPEEPCGDTSEGIAQGSSESQYLLYSLRSSFEVNAMNDKSKVTQNQSSSKIENTDSFKGRNGEAKYSNKQTNRSRDSVNIKPAPFILEH